MMNKILTRRTQEYFEVLDDLHAKHYVTNEQWQTLSAKDQVNTLRMTSRAIEDALLEYGYSKGSPTEQKKYRLLWMQEIGIIAENNKTNNLIPKNIRKIYKLINNNQENLIFINILKSKFRR